MRSQHRLTQLLAFQVHMNADRLDMFVRIVLKKRKCSVFIDAEF